MLNVFSPVWPTAPVSHCDFEPYRDIEMLDAESSVWPVTTHVDMYMGNLAHELVELFPEVVEAPHGADACSLLDSPPPSPRAEPQPRPRASKQRAKRRRRDRKRSERQKEVESRRRKANKLRERARRVKCLEEERCLRALIRESVYQFADALGMEVDCHLLPLLPPELQEIIAHADAAMEAYRGFSGQKTLSSELNQLPTWW